MEKAAEAVTKDVLNKLMVIVSSHMPASQSLSSNDIERSSASTATPNNSVSMTPFSSSTTTVSNEQFADATAGTALYTADDYFTKGTAAKRILQVCSLLNCKTHSYMHTRGTHAHTLAEYVAC